MGNPKRQGSNQEKSGKTLVQKSGSLTRYFRDSSDCEAGADVNKMAAMESENDIEPSSLANSEISNKSLESRRDADIRDLLRNLPSKADLASMLGKLEASFQNNIKTIEAEVQPVSHRVTDLEEERDIIQAQITNLSYTLESQTSALMGFQRGDRSIESFHPIEETHKTREKTTINPGLAVSPRN
ncbi:Hypothetical predicted protein [Pelobates cultripes]|uniref:Uncharacterized protein n=1 Tax=Pelobates cultripes TaxID=61616 RepID=A0AAD1W0F6_PELCU|nr:Hypothetical predicted protein [Pelobates cultripes]